MRLRLTRRRLLAGLAILPAAPALARPATVEDVMRHEGLGQVLVAPGERWLLLETQGPYASGTRFDYGQLNPMFRTTIGIVDLAAPAPPALLLSASGDTGYRLGPPSPAGGSVAVYRLEDDSWSVGVAELATGRVRWLDLTPDFAFDRTTLQWRDETSLVLVALDGGDQPRDVQSARPQQALPALWAAQARGGETALVLGSGRYLALETQRRRKRLVLANVASGALRTLATGEFSDLEVSPDGRRVAALEAAEPIALKPDRPVQGENGIAVRRQRLRLVDLQRPAVLSPLETLDILGSVLEWSPDGRELLVYGRADGQPWRAGGLKRVTADGGRVAGAAPGFAAEIRGRPEIVRAGWWGADPLAFGRLATASGKPAPARADWVRFGPEGPTNLTATLAQPPTDDLLVARDTLLALSEGCLWRLDRRGNATPMPGDNWRPVPSRRPGERDRTAYSLRWRSELLFRRPGAPDDALLRVTRKGPEQSGLRIPGDAELLALAPRQSAAAVRTLSPGGAQTVALLPSGGTPLRLAALDTGLDLDPPRLRSFRHRGPAGEALTSWLLLPARSDRPPPLVVWPYPGRVFGASPPAFADLRRDLMAQPPALLPGQGYAVLLPSLPSHTDGRGPGEGMADEILAIVNAAAADLALRDAFDPNRLGLWGHSFGGYAVLAAVTQTQRFAAAIAAATPSNLFSKHGQIGVLGRTYWTEGPAVAWSAGWVEDLQGDMRAPPWADPDRYLRNSPQLHADRVTTPLMLIQGEEDTMAIHEAEQMFSALFRQGKDAVLLNYRGEGHIIEGPGNQRDMYRRAFSWLDSHLRPTFAAN